MSLQEKKAAYEQQLKKESHICLSVLLLCIIAASVLLRFYFHGFGYLLILLLTGLMLFSLLFFVFPYYRRKHRVIPFEKELAAIVAQKETNSRKEDFYEALTHMKHAPANWFGEVTLQFNLSTALFDKGEAQAACALLEELETVAPQNVLRPIRLQKEAIQKTLTQKSKT